MPRPIERRCALGNDEQRAAATRRHPLTLPAATARLQSAFGETTIRPLLAQLADLLDEALAADDDVDLAHRIAGISGSLGFASLSEAWLAASNAETGADERAHLEAQRALAAIRRHLG